MSYGFFIDVQSQGQAASQESSRQSTQLQFGCAAFDVSKDAEVLTDALRNARAFTGFDGELSVF